MFPDDAWSEGVIIGLREDADQHRHSGSRGLTGCGDDGLESNGVCGIGGSFEGGSQQFRGWCAEFASGANGSRTHDGLGILQQRQQQGFFEHPGNAEDPEAAESCFSLRVVCHQPVQAVLQLGGAVLQESFGEQSLSGVAAKAIGAAEHLKEGLVRLRGEIEGAGVRSILVANAVQSAAKPIDSAGVSIRVLVAVISVVPVQDTEAAVRSGFLHNGHEPCVVGGEQIVFRFTPIGCTLRYYSITVDAAAVNVAHVEFAAEGFRVGITVIPVDPAIGCFLMTVLDDAFNFPGEGRIGAPLTVVVAGFGEVPEVIDDAGADEGFAGIIESDTPGVAGTFAEHLKFACGRMDTEHGACEFPAFAVGFEIGV